MLNCSASLAMSTGILKALPGKLDIKRHSPSILNIFSFCNSCFSLVVLWCLAYIYTIAVKDTLYQAPHTRFLTSLTLEGILFPMS